MASGAHGIQSVGIDPVADRVEVEIELGGFALSDRPQRLETVGHALRRFRTVIDATISISAAGMNERMLVAIDAGRAYLGLEQGLRFFQFARPLTGVSRSTMRISGQETQIDDRNVIDLDLAATIVERWILPGMEGDLGRWEAT